MKWISEYFQEEDEYKDKTEFILGVGKKIPSQLPFPTFNVAKTVKNPIPILDFETLNIKSYMKKEIIGSKFYQIILRLFIYKWYAVYFFYF